MADPVSNPQNPDQTNLPDSSGDARPSGAEYNEAPDLETQVDDLLAEVTETVDEISRKLGHDEPEPTSPAPDYTDTDALDDELAALADDPELEDLDAQIVEPGAIEPVAADATDPPPTAEADDARAEPIADPTPEAEHEAPEPAVALDVPATARVPEEEQEPIAAVPPDDLTPEPDPAPASENATAPETRSEQTAEPTPEPAPQPMAASVAEPAAANDADAAAETDNPPADYTDTAALEDELAALADDAHIDNLDATFTDHEAQAAASDTEVDAAPETGPASLAAAASAVAESEAPTDPADGQPDAEPAATPKTRSPDYTDTGALEDELAALAADADVDGFDADFTDHEPVTTTESSSLDDELASLAADAPDEALGVTAAADSAEAPARPGADASVEPTASPATEDGAQSEHTAKPTGPLKWGWLPPKPDWPEIYSKARPLVIAWRHAAWVAPPLLAYLASLAWANTKTAAIRAEPHARHAVAVAATPLSSREDRTRSIIGWFAIYTFFVATCLWIYVLIGRSPVVPEPTATPTTLDGQATTITADADG